FHLGRVNPARADAATVALLVDLRPGRDAVPDGELADIAILQVCDALIGIDAGGVSLFSGQSADVRAGDEWFRRLDLQAGLEDKPGVANLVGVEVSVAIDRDHRDRPAACGNQLPGNSQRLHRTHRNCQTQALAARDLLLFRQGCLGREVNVHLNAARTAIPVE